MGGFTFLEVMVVVAVLGVLVALVVPLAHRASLKAKGEQETQNLRLLESAKRQWAMDNPGQTLGSPSELVRYLPGGQMPKSPWGGSYEAMSNGKYVYEGIADLDRTIVSPFNNDPVYELGGSGGGDGVNEVSGGGMVYVEKAAGGLPPQAPSAMQVATPSPNLPPTVDLQVSPSRGPPGMLFTFTAQGFDPEGGPVEYLFSTGGSWGNATVVSLPGLPMGAHKVTVRARDREGLVSVPAEQVVTVENGGPRVQLAGSPPEGYLGTSFEFVATASDPENDPLEYSFDEGVTWGKSPVHRVLGSVRGPLRGRVLVRDVHGALSDPGESTVSVLNRPPTVFLEAKPLESHRGGNFVFTATHLDEDGDSVTYSFNGGRYQPEGVLTRSYDGLGSQVVRVRGLDSQGANSEEVSVTVRVVNRPPDVSLSPATQSVFRNQPFTVTANGGDPDVGDVVTYEFKVGTGPWVPSGAVFSSSIPSVGTYEVRVRASDGQGGVDEAQATVVVGNQPPTVFLTASPGSGYLSQVFTFKARGLDPESEGLSYQFFDGVRWGDWSDSDVFLWRADVLGNKTVSVRARDPQLAQSEVEEATVLVENRAPEAFLKPYVGGVEQWVGYRDTAFQFVATGTDLDGDASLSYLFEGLSWGASQTYEVSPKALGNQTVRVWVRDRHGLQSSPAMATVQVVNRVPTVTLSPKTQSVFMNQGFSVNAVGSDPDASDRASLTYRFRVGGGSWTSWGPSVFTGAIPTRGSHTVTVEVRDGQGGTAQDTATVQVVNRPPNVSLSPPTQSIGPGQSFTVTASGNDPDPGDFVTYEFKVGTGAWVPSGAVFSRPLSSLGTYEVRVRASDGQGGVAEATATVVVRDSNRRVTVLASPSSWGTASGSGIYPQGSTVTASVAPNFGYEFSAWEARPGQGNPYSFVVSDDVVLTGVLVPKLYRIRLETLAQVGGGTAANSYGLHADVTAAVYTSGGRLLGTISSSATNLGNNASDRDEVFIWAPYGETVYVNAVVNTRHSMSITAIWSPGNTATAKDGLDDPNAPRAQYYHDAWASWSNSSWSGTNLLTMVVGGWDGQYLGMIGAGTPLLIDLSGDGRPDLLGGGDWRLTPSRRPSSDPSVYREVNLQGLDMGLWEWVGPSDGLLVYLRDLSGTPSAKDLFGTQTFGKSWRHGFEPLATLDVDGDGELKAGELDEVGVWVDANSDAQAQEGEVRKARDVGLTQLSLGFASDEFGNVSVGQGAELRGARVAIWDWISYRYPKTSPDNEVARWDWVNVAPPLEKFPVEVGAGLQKLEMSGGGTLRLHRIDGRFYMRATAAYSGAESPVVDFLFPARVVAPGVIEWGAGPVRNTLFASGLDFYGLTLAGADRYGVWSAKLISGDLGGVFSSRFSGAGSAESKELPGNP